MRFSKILKRCIECKWGPQYLMKDKNGNFNGESSPLWVNASPTCFLIQSALAILLFVGLMVSYIIIIGDYSESCAQSMKPIIVIIIAIVLLSGLIDFRLYQLKYASDQTWFQVIVLQFILLLAFLIVLVVSFFIVIFIIDIDFILQQKIVKEFTKMQGFECQDQDVMDNQIWRATAIISIVLGLIFISKLISLILLISKFYSKSQKFIAIAQLPKKSDIEE